MMEPEPTNLNHSYLDDDIDMKELFGVLWAGKKLIILITSVFALGSILYALSLTNYYKSEAIFNLAGEAESTVSLSGYRGLASIAGINIPRSGEDKGALVLETIMSRAFLKHLFTFENILPSLMAAKTFDTKNQILIFDESKYNNKSSTWVRDVKPPYQVTPSVLETYLVYQQIVIVSQNPETGFINISTEHVSPIFAKEFLELIVREVNVLLRQKDLEESSNALEYLKSEISKTPLIEIKNSINQLIKTQLETQMVAKIREEYALRAIEPPFVPERKSKPDRALICIFGSMLGGMLGVLWVLIRRYALTLDIGEQESGS